MTEAEISVLSTKLDNLGQRLEDQHEALAEHIGELKGKVGGLERALRGNGKPGLETRVALAEQRWKLLTWVVALVAGAAVSALFRVFG